MARPRPSSWADMTPNEKREHFLEWRALLKGKAIVTTEWASSPAGLVFSNLRIEGTRSVCDITAPTSSFASRYLVRCRITDQDGRIYEAEPPVELKINPAPLYVIPPPPPAPSVDVPTKVFTLAMFVPTVTAPSTEGELVFSARFNRLESARLNKTFAGAPDDNTRSTVSVWLKLCNWKHMPNPGRVIILEGGGTDVGEVDYERLSFTASVLEDRNGSLVYEPANDIFGFAINSLIESDAQFLDPSAWMHVVVAIDSNQVTPSDRVNLYVNGELLPEDDLGGFGGVPTYPELAQTHNWLGTDGTAFCQDNSGDGGMVGFDGYMAEVNVIDGAQAAASSFGKLDADKGAWVPVPYAGSYGSNGFHLDFADSADLGKDVSGNANDFTSTGMDAADQYTDTPSHGYPTIMEVNEQGQGFEGSANAGGLDGIHVTDGNLTMVTDGLGWNFGRSSWGLTSQKWYWECEFDLIPSAGRCAAGINDPTYPIEILNDAVNLQGWHVLEDTGDFYSNGSAGVASGTGAFSAGDIAQFAYDADAHKLWVGKNGTFQGDPVAGTGAVVALLTLLPGQQLAVIPGGACNADSGGANTGQLVWNFGAVAFTHTPPAGYSAMSTENMLPANYGSSEHPSAHVEALLYEGDGLDARTIQGRGIIHPAAVWLGRYVGDVGETARHVWVDDARGADKRHDSSIVSAIETTQLDMMQSFDAGGVTVGTSPQVNHAAGSYFAWMFARGPGFDAVAYTGTGAKKQLVPHGLGGAPELIVVKNRHESDFWIVYWLSQIAQAVFNVDPYVPVLNPWDYERGWDTQVPELDGSIWNGTAPSATHVMLGDNPMVNRLGDEYLMWVWRGVPGLCRFGVEIGRSNFPIWCGFRPAMVWTMGMNPDSSPNANMWRMLDFPDRAPGIHEGGFNYGFGVTEEVNPSGAPSTTTRDFAYLGNGFRRSDTAPNPRGFSWVAFAETAFKHSRAV